MQPEFLPIIYGLFSAASWGAGDFCGGLVTKRAPVFSVVITSQIIGFVMILGIAIITHEPMPPPEHLLGGAFAGLAGAVGVLVFYQALSTGRMSIVAPVSGVVAGLVPVVASIFLIGLPGPIKLIGFALAFIGVWLISQHESVSFTLKELGAPLIAGLGFGLFITLISRVNSISALYPIVAARIASITVMVIIARITKQPQVPPRAQLPLTAAAGILDAAGNAFLVLSAQVGRLDVAAVLSGLYPASTIVLAGLVLHEHLNPRQIVGVVAALAAIVLIALP